MERTKRYLSRKWLAVIFCFVACFNSFYSYSQILPGLQNSFNAHQKLNLQEKLYVHTSKNFYLTGEILWFKIFNTEGTSNKLLDISKVVYIELLDNERNAVLQAKIEMKGGLGNGSFDLPLSLSNGVYQLRAYTNWMKNFDADLFFQKRIVVINPLKQSDVKDKPATNAFDVQFFPEGGHLVKGLKSKVGFKITAPDGYGRSGDGVIIDKSNDTVVRFKSLKFGMGSFNFLPLSQVGYRAVINVGDNKITKDLPTIDPTGYVMSTTPNDDSWAVAVKSADSQTTAGIYMVVFSHKLIKVAENAAMVKGSAHFNINKKNLDDGISCVTIFDEKRRPLCERLIFKQPVKKLIINARADDQSFTTRKKINIILSTSDQENRVLAAKLSISVYRLDSLQKDDAGHIGSYCWLNADLKGYIESPDYYLHNQSAEANQALENLLLSQGWTQYDWSKIKATTGLIYLPEYTGPIISGNIVNTITGRQAPNINAYLTIAGVHRQLYIAKSDSAGNILFNTKIFYGENELITQTNWRQDSIYRIDIKGPFSEQYGHQLLPDYILNTNLTDVLAENSINMQVQNIFTAKHLKEFYEPKIDTSFFYGKPDYSYKLDDYTRFRTMEEVIHEYVRLIGITRQRGKRGFDVIYNKTTLPGEPLAMLDGRPIFDQEKIFLIDPLKIKRLDVITNNYIYGPEVLHGILNFNTYTGASDTIQIDPRAVVFDYEGLQPERKFYSPVYETEQQFNSSIPDFRNVLYWNANADTNQDGHSTLSFYAGDKPGRYIGVIEGVTKDGKAGSQQFFFDVK